MRERCCSQERHRAHAGASCKRGSPPQVTSLAWASNDLMIASGRGNHTMQLWSPKTGQKLQSVPTLAPVQPRRAVRMPVLTEQAA